MYTHTGVCNRYILSYIIKKLHFTHVFLVYRRHLTMATMAMRTTNKKDDVKSKKNKSQQKNLMKMHSGYLYQTVPLFFFSSRCVKFFEFTPFASYPVVKKVAQQKQARF